MRAINQADLPKTRANYVPLSPVQFLERSALIYPDKIAIRYDAVVYTYREFEARCRRLASALSERGIGRGDTVAVLAPNVPAMLEAHYGIPALGAILNPLNYRLDAPTIAYCLNYGEAKALIVDVEFLPLLTDVLPLLEHDILLITIEDTCVESAVNFADVERHAHIYYEELLSEGDPEYLWAGPDDEWDSLSLLFTSGTTGDPKGVLYHHRGAYLNALGSALAFGLLPSSVYLWTLPMFHCNGWTYTWAVTAAGGTHVCLRRVEPARIFRIIQEHVVTHLCGAPIVLSMLIHAPEEVKIQFDHPVEILTGGAAPPSTVIDATEKMGFKVTHAYGLTESYGPSMICAWQDEWAGLPLIERSQRMARQGVPMLTMAYATVADPDTHFAVPQDGVTMGELMLRSNTLMKGYLKDQPATDMAFREGWFHTGDLAVWHADNYVEIKDRSKDIIISGGENISSLEVEECLYRHPQVMEAAVVARPDAKWGETPCAFVTLKPDTAAITEEEIIAWCQQHIARYKVPRSVVFGPLDKTATGKIQKFTLRERAKNL
ncbi:AMP-binding protein [Glaciimonas immobilis]|uniref:Fatty-acyl-CoA synthase n=1 Tax=Glaciimonas immobilis TaxID=728004 RepID=A0A840RMI7_9BURK|nr:AMP-binding protein [Glaciimonas immobilis]KAF3997845.1 AMP-binding protein [Glaciimonas immobilis]MBB5199517.1 fatty-acyl-CoA synthase [Glaciimonas immobilis]